MTKRFTYEKHRVKDNLTGEVHSSNMVSVNVLNELYEENTELKSILKDIVYKSEVNLSYSEPICFVKVMVSPQMYKTLTEMLKLRMKEIMEVKEK